MDRFDMDELEESGYRLQNGVYRLTEETTYTPYTESPEYQGGNNGSECQGGEGRRRTKSK